MANYSLSAPAQNDLVAIYKYGIKYFGRDQAANLLYELEAFMMELAIRPELSRDASNIAASLKFYAFKAHVIFYMQENADEIYVVRVLGKRMNFLENL